MSVVKRGTVAQGNPCAAVPRETSDDPPAHMVALAEAAASRGVPFSLRRVVRTTIAWVFKVPRAEQLAFDYDRKPAPVGAIEPAKKPARKPARRRS